MKPPKSVKIPPMERNKSPKNCPMPASLLVISVAVFCIALLLLPLKSNHVVIELLLLIPVFDVAFIFLPSNQTFKFHSTTYFI